MIHVNKNNQKKILYFIFFNLGISSLIAQSLIIRELMIAFYGNELFAALSLGFWLILTGFGSLFFANLFKKSNPLKTTIYALISVSVFLPIGIIAIGFIKNLFSLPGEIPNLLIALFCAFFALIPICLTLGLLWTIASKLYVRLTKKISLNIGKAYFLEILGFIFGGLIFSFFLIKLNEFLIISLIISLNLVAATLLTFAIRKKSVFLRILTCSLLILSFCFFTSPLSNKMQNIILKSRFENQFLVESVNSKYGNISVTQTDNKSEQFNFYQNGLLLGSNQETNFNEQLIHLPLLYSQNPKTILLVGTGFNGALNEILKHPIEKITYLELDSKLIAITEKYISQNLLESVKNPKVKIIHQDVRYFLKNNSDKKFDVIIFNLPDPSSLLLNRFYTQEFFEETKNNLNPKGLIGLHLSSAPNYFSPEIVNLNASVYQALNKNFPQITVLPIENTNFFLAFSGNTLIPNIETITNRFYDRELKTNFITSQWLSYNLTNDRTKSVNKLLSENKTVKTNSDFLASAYLANLLFWLKQFYPKIATFLNNLHKINPLFILLCLLSIFVIFRKKIIKSDKTLPIISAIPDFTLLSLEILFIFIFQIFYGYIYHYIALLIAFIMLGMAIGNWQALQKIKKGQVNIDFLTKIYLLLILLCCFFLFSVKLSYNLWLITPFLAGILIGYEFPLTNFLFLKKQKQTERKTGIIYAADLIGSCLGAILVPLFLLPFFGLTQTIFFLIGLNILAVIILYSLKTSALKT